MKPETKKVAIIFLLLSATGTWFIWPVCSQVLSAIHNHGISLTRCLWLSMLVVDIFTIGVASRRLWTGNRWGLQLSWILAMVWLLTGIWYVPTAIAGRLQASDRLGDLDSWNKPEGPRTLTVAERRAVMHETLTSPIFYSWVLPPLVWLIYSGRRSVRTKFL